jgi:hypothetical protein
MIAQSANVLNQEECLAPTTLCRSGDSDTGKHVFSHSLCEGFLFNNHLIYHGSLSILSCFSKISLILMLALPSP